MRLYIHGTEKRHAYHDEDDGLTGAIRAATTVRVPVSSVAGLHTALARLITEGKTIRRVLWMTHGTPGSIYFAHGEELNSKRLNDEFAGKGYEKLFPKSAKMYFSGCSVAGDESCNGSCNPATYGNGWKFLESAGNVFLGAGGYTMGWTSLGHGWNSSVIRKIISSHSLHFSGDVRIVTFGSGGTKLERLSYDGGLMSGDMLKMVQIFAKLNRLVPNDA